MLYPKFCFPLLSHFLCRWFLSLSTSPAKESLSLPQEMGGDEPEERNWKGIIIAVLVICFVIGMIITSVMLLTPPDLGPRIKGDRMTMRQLLDADFAIDPFNGTWISSESRAKGFCALFYVDKMGQNFHWIIYIISFIQRLVPLNILYSQVVRNFLLTLWLLGWVF